MSEINVVPPKYESIGQVLEEAMQGICGLEEKNLEMQNVLKELHNGLLDVNTSVNSVGLSPSGQPTIDSNTDDQSELIDLRAKNKLLLDQLAEVKSVASDIIAKLTSKINPNDVESVANNSGLLKLKKKLSESSLVCQKQTNNSIDDSTLLKVTSVPLKNSNEINTSQASHNSGCYLDQSSNADELQHQLSDALEKNVKWQHYNLEREHYVSLLLSKYNQNCKELQSMREKFVQISSCPDKLAVEQRRYFDKLLVDARQELECQRIKTLQFSTELAILKDKHKEEMTRLEKGVEQWRKRYEEQREAIAALNANYENEKRRSNSNAFESKEKQSQIQLLHRQLQLFSEDFRAEKKEKEIAENEISFLREKVFQLERQVEKYKKSRSSVNEILKESVLYDYCKPTSENQQKVRKKTFQCSTDSKPLPYSKSNNEARINSPQISNNVTVRRIPGSQISKSKLTEPKQETKNLHKNQSSPYKGSAKSNNEGKSYKRPTYPEVSGKKPSRKRLSETDSLLQCPTCGKQYNIDEHVILLEHIDVCGD